MDHHLKGLIAALALSACSAYAGYAQPSPPSGWSSGGGAGGSFFGTKAGNAPVFTTTATANVGGRSVAMNATARFASNAPRYAAAAVMMHPTVRTVSTVAGWLFAAGLVYDAASGMWESNNSQYLPEGTYSSDGYTYYTNGFSAHSAQAACEGGTPIPTGGRTARLLRIEWQPSGEPLLCRYSLYKVNGSLELENWTSNRLSRSTSSCPAGWYITPAGCVQNPPLKQFTPEEAAEELTKYPMPSDVPQHIPAPIPIDVPQIEPTFIPSGDPVPNPKFDPSSPVSPSNPPATQPGTEVRPAPAPGSPWQVSLRPVDKPITDPDAPPVREPTPLPDGGGSGTGNTPKDPDKTGLCDQYPNILACQTLEPFDDDTKLPEKEIDFDFNPLPGFQGSKVCPSFPSIGNALGGAQLSWQPFCDQLSKLATLILAFAWFGAAWIIFKYAR